MLGEYFFLVASETIPKQPVTLDNKLSFAAIIISILAIGGSFFTVFWQGRQNASRQKIDLESVFYKDIYWDYLIKKIPESRDFVKHNGVENRITGTDNIIDDLNNIRRDSLFFKFTDENFYEEICEKLQNLEDKYVKADKMILAKYDQFNIEVDQMLTEIYDIITSKYTGTDTAKS